METAARYLIAKYAPDLQRLETTNIGLILWSPHGTATRFLTEDEAREVVSDRKTYRRWVSFWTKIAGEKAISLYRGKTVKRTSAKFLDALRETQKGNYLLYDAGFVADDLKASEFETAAEFLFDRLVSRPSSGTAEKERIAAVSADVLGAAGITDMPGYTPTLDVACKIYGIKQKLRFDFGVQPDSQPPNLLFQRVLLDRQQSVTSGAFKFEWVVKENILKREKCVALILADEVTVKESRPSLKLLGQLSHVVNLHDKDRAKDELQKIAA